MKNKILQLIMMGLIGIVLIMFLGLNNIAQASNTTKLKSLSIEPGGTLEQDSENSMIYRTKVENNVNSIKVNVVPYDSNSKITIEGNENLEVGTNKVNIKVTSQSGESVNYIIYVRKLSNQNAEQIIPNVQENSAEEIKNNEQVNNEQKIENNNETNNVNETNNEIAEKNETTEETAEQVNQENQNTNSEELNNKNELNKENLNNNIEDKESNTNNMWIFIVIAICVIVIIVVLIINKNRNKGKH